MSGSIRNSNLFSGEDYQKVFKAFSFISYQAYDFDSIKQALINYLQTYYPEQFSDYTESSEMIAIIEMLSYFGTSLAFRTDLNSRENFIDTATRRSSIIQLASMVNYVPKRNICASGLFKIASVQTDQPLVDANGININDTSVFWNDPNNPDWFDQFIQICNASFSTLNPFGRPTKSGVIGSIPTDLYELNSVLRLNVAYSTAININGQQYPIDICNPDFITNQTIFERDPDPTNPFNFIYRNDSLGVASANTGFFLYFKQGNLINVDTNFEFPVPNRLFPIDIQNINQTDVFVQETDQSGNVVNKWVKVPALAGENIIYNSIQFGERNIFDVISGANDTVTVRFADGNFGNVPTGLFRFWVRISANQALVIRPNDAQGLQISIPYIGVDQQQYNLTITFNLEQTIGNAAPAETDDQIRLRAPEVFSTQSRMVNGSDYNVLPLVYGNQITKIQAIDRTYSGQSRYIDLNDPTGFHRDLIIFGQDGALFRDNQNILREVIETSSNSGTIESIVLNNIQEMLRDPKVSAFFYDEYIPQFESTIRVDSGAYSILEVGNPNQDSLIWQTSPLKFKNDTGYFANTIGGDAVALVNTYTTNNIIGGIYEPWGMMKSGAVVQFERVEGATDTLSTVTINNVIQSGLPLIINPTNPFANIGPVELSEEIQNNYQAVKIIPIFRSTLNTTEIAEIVAAINTGISFWIYYDLLLDEWHTSNSSTPGLTDQSQQPFKYAPAIIAGANVEIYSNWPPYSAGGMVYVNIASNNQLGITTFDLTARGRIYVFESYRDVRFYWEPGQVVVDNASGLALQDTIEIMPFVNTNHLVDNNIPVIPNPPIKPFMQQEVDFNITGIFTQDDGYIDSSKVQVYLQDTNGDGIADDPDQFNSIVASADRIVFEFYTNEVSGYQSTRPWISRWGTQLSEINSTDLFVYFPVTSSLSTTLYSPPYIANHQFNPSTQQAYILDPGSYTGIDPSFRFVYMDTADLIFINNLHQIAFDPLLPVNSISNQVTAFFNYDITTYPWFGNTANVIDRSAILANYFLNKSFLLSATSPPGYGVYQALTTVPTVNPIYPSKQIIENIIDKTHFDKNGKVFTQNTSIAEASRLPLYFKWSHYSPIDQRVDPSPTNIIDMIVITDSFYRDMLIWKNSNGSILTIPSAPTTEELRIQFQDLDQYKMVSDSMIWNSGTFKILFGQQATSELQATIKVVKSPSSNISDNEVKTKVVQAVDAYFDIRNWDFGEKFFWSELSAFIHQQLSKIISSVVIVPNDANSQFGNLFEIVASPVELFMSTLTVTGVQIVANLTDANLRI